MTTADVPGDLPVVERRAVRLVVLDACDRVLLLHIREPLHPELGPCWELPGGGMDGTETPVEAALRELREETGIVVSARDIGAATWRRRSTFRHSGVRRLQDEVVLPVRLGQERPTVDERGQTADEVETYLGYRWWTLDEIEASAERFYPGRLPDLLRRFLAGEHIEEPFEHFS
jgi:8-oxo-dGTP pyrophosphatase MutT (NUDIX family)